MVVVLEASAERTQYAKKLKIVCKTKNVHKTL